jgi:hypothetical protein
VELLKHPRVKDISRETSMNLRSEAPIPTRTRRRALLIGLAIAVLAPLALLVALPAAADLGASDFLKANGKFLRRDAGNGDIVTLRGTNLGGWLTYEDWMSPLGEFALNRSGWSASASLSTGRPVVFWTATAPPGGAPAPVKPAASGSRSILARLP